jgi:hypothetical protein
MIGPSDAYRDDREAGGGDATTDGMTLRRTWPVWSNHARHRVDVAVNALTGSTQISVDGVRVARRSPWHLDANGFELPFDVDGRPCLLVVRHHYGSQPQIELYSEGRSLSTGETLDEHTEAARREIPSLVRMLLIFIPLIGGFNTVVTRSDRFDGTLGGWGPVVVLGTGAAAAAVGWWLAARWYAGGPQGPTRHVVGGAIVVACWAGLFAVFAVVLNSQP